MPSTKKPPESAKTVEIPQIKMVTATFPIKGNSGLYCHRMSQKASRDLFLGGSKKSAAEKLLIKHHPRLEFVDSMYIDVDRFSDAVVMIPAMSFKRAMRTVAVEIGTVKGTQIDRLIFVEDEFVPVFGLPLLRMDITRSSDIGRTPDVRTRAYFPEWGTLFKVRFATPQLTLAKVAALLHNAGILVGVGDNRQERGNGNYGTFTPVSGTKEIAHMMGAAAKAAQRGRIDEPVPDSSHGDTLTLLQRYDAEVAARTA